MKRFRSLALATIPALAAVALLAWYADATGGGFWRRAQATEWHRPAVVDGRTVHLAFDGGDCDAERRIDVEETDSTVTLTALIVEQPGACDDSAVGVQLDAELERPLGDRTLIDGACQGPMAIRDDCPRPVRTGTCGSADYAVDMPIDAAGDVTLRVRVEGAEPGERWHLDWTFASHGESRVDAMDVVAGPDGAWVATRAMGSLPDDANAGRKVDLVPPSGEPCEIAGNPPMSYGF